MRLCVYVCVCVPHQPFSIKAISPPIVFLKRTWEVTNGALHPHLHARTHPLHMHTAEHLSARAIITCRLIAVKHTHQHRMRHIITPDYGTLRGFTEKKKTSHLFSTMPAASEINACCLTSLTLPKQPEDSADGFNGLLLSMFIPAQICHVNTNFF